MRFVPAPLPVEAEFFTASAIAAPQDLHNMLTQQLRTAQEQLQVRKRCGWADSRSQCLRTFITSPHHRLQARAVAQLGKAPCSTPSTQCTPAPITRSNFLCVDGDT